MRQAPWTTVFVLAAVAVVAAAASSSTGVSSAGADPHPALAGKWQIDKARSDDPREKMRERTGGEGGEPGPAGGRGGAGGGGTWGGRGGWGGGDGGGGWGSGSGGGGGSRGGHGGGHGGGRGGPGGGHGGGGENPENTAWREHMRGLLGHADVLSIAADGDQLRIAYEDGAARTLAMDGKWHRPETDKENGLESKASWEGIDLVLEARSPHGGKSTETFELAPDGGHLSVRVKLDHERMKKPVEILRFYDPLADAPPAAPSPTPAS